MSLFKSPGERGAQGDHGQTGADGRAGVAGPAGPSGTVGDDGMRGARGKAGHVLTRFQLLAYVVVVAAAGYLFWQGDQHDRDSLKQREQLCLQSRENREAVRDVYRDVANLGRSLTQGNPDAERTDAIKSQLDAFERDRLTSFPPIPPGCPKR